MKIFITGVMALFSVLVIGRPAFANTWSRFDQVESRYYRLDKQPVSTISCRINVQTVTEMVNFFKNSFAGKVDLTDTLNDYRVIYRKSSGVDIKNPKFGFKLVDKNAVTDPARLALGEKQVRAGLDNQVDGADKMIRALFDDYGSPAPDTYHVESLSENKGKYTLHYRHDGSDVVEVISGNKTSTTTRQNNLQIISHSIYTKTPSGQLIFSSAVMHSDFPSLTMDSTIKVIYQNLNGIIFPSEMRTVNTISTQGSKRKMPVNIRFTDCQVLQ